MNPVFKILRAHEWQAFEAEGRFCGSPDDKADNFIHLSAEDQIKGTRSRHFSGETGLVLLKLDADALGPALKWEVSRGSVVFPHLYRVLERADVIEAKPL